jgi:leader peptidase (prepilin peptidase)/N-methyltransferase
MIFLNYLLIFYCGCLVGSFLNVVILRLPQGQKLTGRSRCLSCGRQLKPLELLPVLSFLFLCGRCSKCKTKISWRYFVIELLTGLLFAAVWKFGQPLVSFADYLFLVRNFAVVSILVLVFVIDFEHYLILDAVVFPGLALVLLLNLAIGEATGYGFMPGLHNFLWSLLYAVIAAAPFALLWLASRGRWLGLGDVKFVLFIGAVFGWPLLAVSLMSAVFIGGASSVLLLLSKRKTLASRVPFGTFLSLGAAATLFYGQKLLDWYLSWVGF